MKVLAERDFTIIPVNFLISGKKKTPGSTQNMTKVKKHFLIGKKKKRKKSFYTDISWTVIFEKFL